MSSTGQLQLVLERKHTNTYDGNVTHQLRREAERKKHIGAFHTRILLFRLQNRVENASGSMLTRGGQISISCFFIVLLFVVVLKYLNENTRQRY